jgi:hypothetical protein
VRRWKGGCGKRGHENRWSKYKEGPNTDKRWNRFIDSEKWRSSFGGGLDNLVPNFDYKEKPQVFAYYPQYYHKTDKDGRPLYIEQLGKINLDAMRKITTDERMLSNLVVEYEKMADPRLPACSRKSGHLLETSCSIMDLKGVGIGMMSSAYGYLQQASAISQNYYPERLGKLYVINAPWGFSGAFSVVKKFLDPVTVAKIHVLGGNYQKELLAQIPKENLPKQFGGECTCPGGCELSDEGPCKWIHTQSLSAREDTNCLKQGKIPSGPRPQPGRRRTTTPSLPPRATSAKASPHPQHLSPDSLLVRPSPLPPLCLSRRSVVLCFRCFFNMIWVFCMADQWVTENWC